MDELLDKINTAHITLDESDISLTHPRYWDLQRKKPEVSQEKRRKEWLQELKKKRETQLNISRRLESNGNGGESMEVDKTKKQIPFKNEYKGWLMLSEWLIEVPKDLHENWMCIICPVGTRALVVANEGRTTAYRRNGRSLCFEFPSSLPGGSAITTRGPTILDTVFHRPSNTFYILDVIHWGIETVDLEAEMRFFWLQTKHQETPEVIEKARHNKYKFLCAEHVPFSNLQEKMGKHPVYPGNCPEVDGIIFFHREGTYVHSRSPLVTWLKPFMLPDLLKMEIPPQYLEERPPAYQKMDTDVPS